MLGMMDKEIFLRTLYALYNIGGNATPEEDDGIVMSEVALMVAEALFPTEEQVKEYMVAKGWSREAVDEINFDEQAIESGVLTAAGLYDEIMMESRVEMREDPVDYAEYLITAGLAGIRVEDETNYKQLRQALEKAAEG